MTELKPCPFCGMSVHWEAYDGVVHDQINWCYLHSFPYNGECNVYEEDKEEVICSWNRRAKDKDLLDLAISLVQDELVTVGKGADIAGLPYYEFEDELKKRGIRWKG